VFVYMCLCLYICVCLILLLLNCEHLGICMAITLGTVKIVRTKTRSINFLTGDKSESCRYILICFHMSTFPDKMISAVLDV